MKCRPHQMVVAQLLKHQDSGYVVVEFGMDGESVGCTPICATPDEANDCDELHADPDRKHCHPAWSPVANLLRE